MKQKPYKTKDAKTAQAEEPITAFITKPSGDPLKGAEYLTADEFKVATDTMIDNLYKKHGLL